ncbi:Uncharacterized protein PBTT_00098 [Plasmodiophora brassicae]|uniref:Uncharacterized protein n=1 Tax=Plasmodiophora brassicae TaxID=37360 RepID=A0A0G4J3G0_PLABS|nr:hypothetical protein PBRA_002398 [Plasmodiophora brassicae]
MVRVSNNMFGLGLIGLAGLAFAYPYYFIKSKLSNGPDRRQYSSINSQKKVALPDE